MKGVWSNSEFLSSFGESESLIFHRFYFHCLLNLEAEPIEEFSFKRGEIKFVVLLLSISRIIVEVEQFETICKPRTLLKSGS